MSNPPTAAVASNGHPRPRNRRKPISQPLNNPSPTPSFPTSTNPVHNSPDMAQPPGKPDSRAQNFTNSDPISKSYASTSTFKLRSTHNTLNNLPHNTILVHATNCLGVWGAGIAEAIAKDWPLAKNLYASHCQGVQRGDLEGTCLLIPPQEEGTGPPAANDQEVDFNKMTNEELRSYTFKDVNVMIDLINQDYLWLHEDPETALEWTNRITKAQDPLGAWDTLRRQNEGKGGKPKKEKSKIWIACLFTSYGYGRTTKKKPGKDPRKRFWNIRQGRWLI